MMKDAHAQRRYYEMLNTAFGEEICALLNDDSVIEIMLNPDGSVHVERIGGVKIRLEALVDAQRGINIIKLVASCSNNVADRENPEVATELPVTHARFQGWLPPVVDGPTFAIRKQTQQKLTLEDYQGKGLLTAGRREYLLQALADRKNILIAGGTSSGKTTFANAILRELNQSHDRILVLEDLPELQTQATDVVFMRTSEQVDMRMLVKGSLRMRPDRIVIGEVRDGSALDLLKAWNTGHPGGLCTLHANSAEDAPYRLEDLLQEVVPVVPHNLIVRTLDVIVHLARDSQGLRRVRQIAHLRDYQHGRYIVEFVD
ncbi:Type IV secretion system protein VirB11 [Piscirickettsia salmonis]|uniref:Type IV secretion system protein VirB11 n=1 Tax=Piscirickettsia salmonis TaxID=1238 RepID=A0AAC8ZQ18_PISSA|nr:P-type conjugative transfer ATPase TrbB [Piscirickettsia salmonis]AKP72335.2 conjugal transfer protein TrbB [Piscirickettsia salmonis LF-89 = ATCC VR-1361]ALB24212.1 type IV secretion system protein VirB11 [Piscirickettsia salmonis]ALY04010.1 conjugal transfer protein TrbB [Piscirickettsia salmonis]AMA43574.1 conjugal transfer protein TrbB [Piscirickettsia salmonis]AOS36043.1 conjugal transfer protein TrbB [Piscirickettsia salmonis]